MMAWRVAGALEELRAEINTDYPARDLGADGGIGDVMHQADPSSDHNPHVISAGVPIVTARDYDVDLTGDRAADTVTMQAIADRVAADPRVKYVIFNRRINYGGGWLPYYGSDPHEDHMHVSVLPDPALFDSRAPWAIRGIGNHLAQEEDDMFTDQDRKDLAELRRLLAGLANPGYAADNFNAAIGEKSIADQLFELRRLLAGLANPGYAADNFHAAIGEKSIADQLRDAAGTL